MGQSQKLRIFGIKFKRLKIKKRWILQKIMLKYLQPLLLGIVRI
jgi:hypothetical protein